MGISSVFNKPIDILTVAGRHNKVLLVTERSSWVIDEVCAGLKKAIGNGCGIVAEVYGSLCKKKKVHFINRFPGLDIERVKRLSEHNTLILVWWHGGAYPVKENEEHSNLAPWLDKLSAVSGYINKIQITSSLYHDVLRKRGIPEDKIVYLPMGIRTDRFSLEHDKSYWKKKLGLPLDKFCIASFQRDGSRLPKLVKGPDILAEAVNEIYKKRRDIFLLLTGHERGYVKRHLDKIRVPYKSTGFIPSHELPGCYFASDSYLVSSREEGGPSSVLEAMASKVPLVSTRVGMAVDVVKDKENGLLFDIEDSRGLAEGILRIMEDRELSDRLTANALKTVKDYDWNSLAPRYKELLYNDYTP